MAPSQHEQRLAENRHQEHREMVDGIQGLVGHAGYPLRWVIPQMTEADAT